MSLVVKAGSGGDFIPAPEGVHVAVCVDVVDLGKQQVVYAGKTKTLDFLSIRWQIDEKMEDGQPFLVSRKYNKSLHEKSSLRQALQAWRGKQFTKTELDGFDVETVIGACCQLSVVHAKSQDGESTWANVDSIMALPKGTPGIDPAPGYVRQKDRDTEDAEPQISDDDIPF